MYLNVPKESFSALPSLWSMGGVQDLESLFFSFLLFVGADAGDGTCGLAHALGD